ncbi:MAG: histidine--tRNA ligase [Acutalibacteraceae bacterium]|nr:histidine--tRNA ligase [Acutalibacteraceae bacterium]
MALSIQAIKGTQDVLPQQSYQLRFVENKLLEIAELYGFNELRTPVFEHTELFNRSVGDTTDVVQKEMYTFNDNGGRSISLRPEGTAGAARAFLEHGMHNLPLPQKVSYITSCYRYEKPQAGRLREFHQFGVECFGSDSPVADAEVISLAKNCFDVLGVKNLSLEINSIGCPECRKNYSNALKEYFGSQSDELCDTCKDRLQRNPMRILDCKSPVCKKICENAPTVLEFLCDECKEHFEKVKKQLEALNIEYKVNPKIVRGLDYYTKTVFEFVSNDLGAQSTVCGGGRYDGLIEEIGGQPTPALGFGMGIERLMLILQAQNIELPDSAGCTLYIAPMGEEATLKANVLCDKVRQEGFCALTDLSGRGLKAQMKYANKIGAKFTLVLGDEEIKSNKAKLKNMNDSTETEVELNDNLVETIYNKNIELQFKQLQDSIE